MCFVCMAQFNTCFCLFHASFLMHAELEFSFNLLPKHLETTSESGFALVTCLPAVSILASHNSHFFFRCHKNPQKTLIFQQELLITQLQDYEEKICFIWGVLMPLWTKIHSKYPQCVCFNSYEELCYILPSPKTFRVVSFVVL